MLNFYSFGSDMTCLPKEEEKMAQYIKENFEVGIYDACSKKTFLHFILHLYD